MASYSQRIQRIGPDHYRLWWTVDHKYAGSRLRFPRGHSSDTDTAGAQRFAKRWSVAMPPDPLPKSTPATATEDRSHDR